MIGSFTKGEPMPQKPHIERRFKRHDYVEGS